jgi:glycosyltransferase involved in cell wall biosynthesis
MTLVFAVVFGVLGLTIVGNLFYLRRHRPGAIGRDLPFLSVMIPARNEEANIPRLLESILRQDHPSFEVLIQDDGSEDDTLEAIRAFSDDTRLRIYEGSGPAPGWVGKVHALYVLSRKARGDVYLFLDADVELTSATALQAMSFHYRSLPYAAVMTAMPWLRGGGQLLVSLVPHIILMMLPWFLVRRISIARLGALNGQCWMIDAETYHRHEPHEAHRAEVLEDVIIGRYLKSRGVTPVMADMRGILSVYMYKNLTDAWHGLTKNAYLMAGGHPLATITFLVAWTLVMVVAPMTSLWFVIVLFALKGVTDIAGRFPLWVTLLMPLSYLLAAGVLVASTTAHLTGRVSWKGRNVAPSGNSSPERNHPESLAE